MVVKVKSTATKNNKVNSRIKLLSSTEKILLEEGVTGLSFRNIQEKSGVNSALINYYFGTFDKLLKELVCLNMDQITTEHNKLMKCMSENKSQPPTLKQLIALFIQPLWAKAAYCKNDRAIVIVDEILTRADKELQTMISDHSLAQLTPLLSYIEPLTPHLSLSEIQTRLHFIGAAALGIAPRSNARSISKNDEEKMLQLMDFALAGFQTTT